jgi:hypothetical protein
MDKKKQHFVPEAYLKGWRDPKTPEGLFLWQISKKTRLVTMKSPKNICTEVDFYTKFDEEGNRDIQAEDMLQKIETRFSNVQHDKIEKHKPLSEKDKGVISDFLASMCARVKSQKEPQSEIFKEQLNAIDQIAPQLKESYAYKLMMELSSQPVPLAVEALVRMTNPVFTKMKCTIMENDSSSGFITSDNPCCVVDSNPNLPKRWRRTWQEILATTSFSLAFPMSPRQLIYLSFSGETEYKVVNNKHIDAINGVNKKLVTNSVEFIISNQKECKDEWFEGISS